MDREAIVDLIREKRAVHPVADLALYAFRDMSQCAWEPFVKAALERCPVSLNACARMSIDQVYTWLLDMRSTSIYDAQRLAQPDEVVNFKTGDGLEKAFVLANVIRHQRPTLALEIQASGAQVSLSGLDRVYTFSTCKGLDLVLNIP